MAKFPPEEWQAEQLRFTLFPMPGETFRSTDWWRLVAEGAEPDETTANPKRGSALVKGAYGPGNLLLRLEPDRIDWILGPPEVDPTAQTPELTMPGVAFELMDHFVALISRWLTATDLPGITRVAFGSILLHPVENRQAGYVQLGDYIPVHIEPESSDFLFQINPPAVDSSTGIPNLKLNRLNKWSVAALGVIMLNLSDIGAQAHRELHNCFVRLELDVNTIGTFVGAIPRDRLTDICTELLQQAKGIATQGIIRNAS